jgi:hypothetical protein
VASWRRSWLALLLAAVMAGCLGVEEDLKIDDRASFRRCGSRTIDGAAKPKATKLVAGCGELIFMAPLEPTRKVSGVEVIDGGVQIARLSSRRLSPACRVAGRRVGLTDPWST